MTDTEAEALGKRLVACRHFRPLRGMLDMQGRSWDQSLLWRWSNVCDVPDLRDPATLGCVLALVREAWRCPTIYVRQSTTRRVSDGVIAWEVCDLYLDAEACRALGVSCEGSVGSWGHGSEAEALVVALERAP